MRRVPCKGERELVRDNQDLARRLATVERERDRLQNELRRAETISRELNQEKIQFQGRCEQLEREKMDIRNQITTCRRCPANLLEANHAISITPRGNRETRSGTGASDIAQIL